MIDLKNRLYTDIAIVLAEKHSLTAKEIHQNLKGKGFDYSYQYVHKSLKNLEKYEFVSKMSAKYTLNLKYLTNLKEFLIKASNQYDLDQNVFMQSVTGSLLKVFNKKEAEAISKGVVKQINQKIMEKLDEWYSHYYDPEGKEIKTILSQAQFKGKRVLELGCGTGRLTGKLAKHCKTLVSVDHNEDSIEYCKGKFKKAKNITFVNTSVKELKNLPHKEYDIILSAWVGLHYSKELPKALGKLHKLLSKNGTLIIIEAYLDSEYVKILNLIRPKVSKVREKQSELTSLLFKTFKSIDEKIVSTRYVFPSYEKLEETFKIELVYEEGSVWHDKDSKKLRKYVDEKGNLEVGEALVMWTCTNSK